MSSELTEKQAFVILNALPNIGPITLNRLLDELGGDPRAVFAVNAQRLESVKGVGPAISSTILGWREHFDLAREEERMARSGAEFITARDTGYPRLLKEIHDPPIGLYRRGRYEFEARTVAIVGSRRTTLYGQSTAKRLAGDLARLGFCVVSGLARGIDTAAHEGALSVGGRTAGVLGCGVDIVYPPENLELYRRIEASGAILSEFPFGRRADKQSFAMRNRIIAGICDAVVVVESDVSGGAMITARFAGEQGRLLFAVPGRIDQNSSAGCHQLIRDGATLLTSVDDILSELDYLGGLRPRALVTNSTPETQALPTASELTSPETAVFECLRDGSILSSDAIAVRTGLSAAETGVALMMLELKRLISKRADGAFEIRS
jgi:DNA processing protein